MRRKYPAASEQKRRDKAFAALTRLAATIQAHNQDLTAVVAEEYADRFTREVILEMIAEGKVRYSQRY